MKFYQCDGRQGIIFVEGDIECLGALHDAKTNTDETLAAKHLPAVKIEGDVTVVKVGEVLHPMSKDHHIEWIAIETKNGMQKKRCGDTPVAKFKIVEDEIVNVYAYCNLHGLWHKKIKQ